MTRKEKRRVLSFLNSAGYELGNLDGTEDWGWDGCELAKLLAKSWKIDMDSLRENSYPETLFGKGDF